MAKRNYKYKLAEMRTILHYYRLYQTYSSTRTLYGVYAKPSCYKERAWLEITDERSSKGAQDILHTQPLKVLTYNSMKFTCGYVYRLHTYRTNANGDTVEDKNDMFVVHTPSKRYEISVDILRQFSAGMVVSI